MNEINHIDLKPPVPAAIRTGPGYAVAGHSPGVFIEAPAADLETARADPAKFLPFPAAMALEGSAGTSSRFFGISRHAGLLCK